MTMSILMAVTVGAVIWRVVGHRRKTRTLKVLLIPLAFIMVAVAAPSVQAQIMAGYPDDSFWTLGLFGRIGVVVISSLGLTLIYLALTAAVFYPKRLALWISLPMNILIGLVIYSVIYSVSPQVFYSFYRLIFADLPNQIVIDSILDFDRLQQIIRLGQDGSLSDHLAGIGFWGLVPFLIWVRAPWPVRVKR